MKTYFTEAKRIREIYKLRFSPTITANRSAAISWASTTVELSKVILGDDCKYWVVGIADACRLIKAGYELAE